MPPNQDSAIMNSLDLPFPLDPLHRRPSQATYALYAVLISLLNRLDASRASRTEILSWSAPVPAFGDPSQSLVATLGLNPSNREFLDGHGNELCGALRRFHTLRSLGLSSWREVHADHLRAILQSCNNYFYINPYSRWFKPLDAVLARLGRSYYDSIHPACHLDLVPYATSAKWGMLAPVQRTALLTLAGSTLPVLLRTSPIRILILNGRSVVQYFHLATGVRLLASPMPQWSLPRARGRPVIGVSYSAQVRRLGGWMLDRDLLVLGFNHNLQSSFGVTSVVSQAIGRWIETKCKEVSL